MSAVYKHQKTKRRNSQVVASSQIPHESQLDETEIETDRCPMCGQQDDRMHFLLDCPGLESIRSQHCDLIQTIKQESPWTLWLPVVFKHPHHDAFNLLNQERGLPSPFGYESPHDIPVFYVDGSCRAPDLNGCRLASFAIVLDTALGPLHIRDLLSQYRLSGLLPPSFVCCQTGLVHGQQTITRAELIAILQVVRSTRQAVIRSDSAAAISIFQHLQEGVDALEYVKHSCFDLIIQLGVELQLKGSFSFQIQKIKAHLPDNAATCDAELWDILGNRCADFHCKFCRQGLRALLHFLSKSNVFTASRVNNYNSFFRFWYRWTSIECNPLKFPNEGNLVQLRWCYIRLLNTIGFLARKCHYGHTSPSYLVHSFYGG